MSRPYQPDLVEEGAPPLVQMGKRLPRFPGAGPCGDVHVWEDRALAHDAVWCGPVIVDALLTVDAQLEVYGR